MCLCNDAWGNHKVLNPDGTENTSAGFIGNINPIRYRGYYFDKDLGLYWLKTRFYDPQTGRFISPDSVEYLDPETLGGINLYAYCNNNPVMNVDPNGTFALTLALILGITALAGLGLTIGGAASDNNTMRAIGLTMVAVPALISGVGAVFSGATCLSVIGGVTAFAGLGTGLFASAEYQEAFTGNNWMIDAGMNEKWYNGLMIATATLATAGTITTGVLSSIGNASTPEQMLNSIEKHSSRWKETKRLVEPSKGSLKGGQSTYKNLINKWTGAKGGFHEIIKDGIRRHFHFHPWI